MKFPLCSNVYGDVTDFGIRGFRKYTKNLDISRTKHYFFCKQKKSLHIKGYFMAKTVL